MICPRCESTTKEMSNHDVKLDVCYDGCGGIWFDSFEFKKMDEVHESDDSFLQELSQSAIKPVSLEQKIMCPVCDQQPMVRRFFSVKKSIEVDECPACAGIWLDAGELTHIYSTFSTEEERRQAARDLMDDMFGDEMAALKAESQENLKKAQRFARMFRFLCPSYYIPGKQDWGAF